MIKLPVKQNFIHPILFEGFFHADDTETLNTLGIVWHESKYNVCRLLAASIQKYWNRALKKPSCVEEGRYYCRSVGH